MTQFVGASEADAEIAFMARLLALCSLPRTNPGNRVRYVTLRRFFSNSPINMAEESVWWILTAKIDGRPVIEYSRSN